MPVMSTQPYQQYSHHRPHHGQPYIVVNDHDVLCGRGVNISQHPGNERFRALVNTRTDESYCTTFTTGEKRALAEEIVNHIKSLDPPGRFLKRCGRSHSSRGLSGPWEELTQKECIKKACQALRDCNRLDRTGYAAQVSIPKDVKDNAEERAKAGLSLKEHAAAKVQNAKPFVVHKQTPDPKSSKNANVTLSPRDSRRKKRSATEICSTVSRDTPVELNTDEWTKRPRASVGSVPPNAESGDSAHHIAPRPTNVHSTPAPFMPPVPVTSTPIYPRYANHSHHAPGFASAEISRPPRGYMPPSHHHHHPSHAYHYDPHAIATNTLYSPAALLAPHEAHAAATGFGHPDSDVLDASDDLEPSPYAHHHHDPHFPPPHHHFNPYPTHHYSSSADGTLHAAAEAAAAMNHDDPGTHNHAFPNFGGDDATHDSLGMPGPDL